MSRSKVETLAEFPSSLVELDGAAWVARALGRLRTDGLWEGYLEFERLDGTAVLRTPRETTQPNLTDLLYWASGLTAVYLEGAFGRAEEVPLAQHILTASNTPVTARDAAVVLSPPQNEPHGPDEAREPGDPDGPATSSTPPSSS